MLDLLALEGRLRDALRGRRLVCEAALDGSVHQELIEAIRFLRSSGLANDERILRTKYSAITVGYLVSEGTVRYSAGEFWPKHSFPDLKPGILGPAFEKSLERLELETFHHLVDEGALRYLTPILAHGGIPQYCLGDFFQLLMEELRRGASDAGEVLARWRGARSRFMGIDKPVERFLLHGGETSLDLLDRCIDMVRETAPQGAPPDPLKFGLPPYICQAYATLDPNLKRSVSERLGISLPRPAVFVDPWGATGPALILPAVSGDFIQGSWKVCAINASAAKHAASREERVVALSPALEWSVEFAGERGETLRSFTFPGLDASGALLFEGVTGLLVQHTDRLTTRQVWILLLTGSGGAPIQSNDGRPLQPTEIGSGLTGSWSGYRLAKYDVAGLNGLRFGEGDECHEIAIRVRDEVVAMTGTPVPGVRVETTGAEVYAAVPRLTLRLGAGSPDLDRWRARVDCGGDVHLLDGHGLMQGGEEVLQSLLGPERVMYVRLLIQGPLGADFRAEFAVVPGLDIRRPAALSVPGSAPSALTVVTAVRSQVVAAPPGVDAIDHLVDGPSGSSLRVRIAVPCLQWALLTENGRDGSLDQTVCQLPASEILEGRQTLLVVRTRTQGLTLRLELRDGDQVLQSESVQPPGEEGRWTFDLRLFASTIGLSAAPELTINLVVGSYDVRLAEIRSRAEIRSIRHHQYLVPGRATLQITFDEERLLRNRVARLWPLSRPWMPPIVQLIPDEVGGTVTFERTPEELPPGTYLIEIAVDAGWFTARRPGRGTSGVAELRLGTAADEDEWLRQLPRGDAFRVLTKAYLEGELSRHAIAPMVRIVSPEPFLALATLAEYQSCWSDSEASVEAVVRLLLLDLEGAIAGALDSVSFRRLTPAELLAAALPFLPALIERPDWRLSDSTTDGLWEVCPAWACLLDLLVPDREPGSAQRLETRLGADPLRALNLPFFPHVKQIRVCLQRTAAELEEMRHGAALVPRPMLDLENQASVQFEWLLAAKRGNLCAGDWAWRHASLADSLPTGLSETIRSRFEAIRAVNLVNAWGREIDFPGVVFAAALHVVAGETTSRKAVWALQEIAPACPGIVNRSLALAATLIHYRRW